MLPEEPVITVLFWAMEYFRCMFLLFLTRSRHLKPISFPLGQLVASGLPPVNASLSLSILNKSWTADGNFIETDVFLFSLSCHFLAKITIWKILTRLIDRAHTAQNRGDAEENYFRSKLCSWLQRQNMGAAEGTHPLICQGSKAFLWTSELNIVSVLEQWWLHNSVYSLGFFQLIHHSQFRFLHWFHQAGLLHDAKWKSS